MCHVLALVNLTCVACLCVGRISRLCPAAPGVIRQRCLTLTVLQSPTSSTRRASRSHSTSRRRRASSIGSWSSLPLAPDAAPPHSMASTSVQLRCVIHRVFCAYSMFIYCILNSDFSPLRYTNALFLSYILIASPKLLQGNLVRRKPTFV